MAIHETCGQLNIFEASLDTNPGGDEMHLSSINK